MYRNAVLETPAFGDHALVNEMFANQPRGYRKSPDEAPSLKPHFDDMLMEDRFSWARNLWTQELEVALAPPAEHGEQSEAYETRKRRMAETPPAYKWDMKCVGPYTHTRANSRYLDAANPQRLEWQYYRWIPESEEIAIFCLGTKSWKEKMAQSVIPHQTLCGHTHPLTRSGGSPEEERGAAGLGIPDFVEPTAEWIANLRAKVAAGRKLGEVTSIEFAGVRYKVLVRDGQREIIGREDRGEVVAEPRVSPRRTADAVEPWVSCKMANGQMMLNGRGAARRKHNQRNLLPDDPFDQQFGNWGV